MKELNEKQLKFYANWKERRKKKFQFIFLYGTVYWGIPMGIFLFLFDSHFSTENMNLTRFVITITVFSIGGLFAGLIQYIAIDKRYINLNKDNKIFKE